MAILRADLLTYLQGKLHSLATKVGFAETDTPGQYGAVLDAMFDTLGYPGQGQDPQPEDDTLYEPARSLATYFGLVRLQIEYALFVDTAIDAPTASRKDSQVFRQIKDLMATWADNCATLGFPVNLKNNLEMGEILLDYMAPSIPGINSDLLIGRANLLEF